MTLNTWNVRSLRDASVNNLQQVIKTNLSPLTKMMVKATGAA